MKTQQNTLTYYQCPGCKHVVSAWGPLPIAPACYCSPLAIHHMVGTTDSRLFRGLILEMQEARKNRVLSGIAAYQQEQALRSIRSAAQRDGKRRAKRRRARAAAR